MGRQNELAAEQDCHSKQESRQRFQAGSSHVSHSARQGRSDYVLMWQLAKPRFSKYC